GGVYSTRLARSGAVDGVAITIWFGGFANNIRMWSGGSNAAGSSYNRLIDFNAAGMSTRQNASLALKYLDLVDGAIDKISDARAALGIQERRMMHIIDDLKAEEINVSAAKSRIYDADMAAEISEFTRLQILQQSGTAILAQANAQPQTILQLMK
ncbi:MAG: flagellin, partial [bacterium]